MHLTAAAKGKHRYKRTNVRTNGTSFGLAHGAQQPLAPRTLQPTTQTRHRVSSPLPGACLGCAVSRIRVGATRRRYAVLSQRHSIWRCGLRTRAVWCTVTMHLST
jgi:hypothetical protein